MAISRREMLTRLGKAGLVLGTAGAHQKANLQQPSDSLDIAAPAPPIDQFGVGTVLLVQGTTSGVSVVVAEARYREGRPQADASVLAH